jgi:dTDP-4-dehydrorhamnose reductase
VLNDSGWWQRPARTQSERSKPSSIKPRRDVRTLLITGGGGTLATALREACVARGLRAASLTRAQMDICDEHQVTQALQSLKPWAVVNTAGVSKRGLRHPTEAAMHCVDPAILARACATAGLPFVTFSSEAVFDGTSDTPYDESSSSFSMDARGAACARAELNVQREHPSALVIRSSCFIAGLHDRTQFNEALMKLARAEPVAVPPQLMSPTYVPDLAHAALNLLIDAEHGVWHVVNQGAMTWRTVLEAAAAHLGISTHSLSELESVHTAGRNFVLTSRRGCIMPPLEDALVRFTRSAHESLMQVRRAGGANS